MLLTPEEMAKLWCPHVRVQWVHPDHTGTNPPVNRPEDQTPNCIGPGCSQWRWGPQERTGMVDATSVDAAEAMIDDDETAVNFGTNADGMKKWAVYKRVRGYCGLAGRPEE